MGPVSHFLIGTLCGAAVACVALLFRRRWALYAPPFILACGLWAEMPYLLGSPETSHWLANIFFGYAWLHPSAAGRELAGFALFVVVANVLLAGYVVFVTRYLWAVDMVRWEQGKWTSGPASPKRSKRRRRRRSRAEDDDLDDDEE